MPQDFACCSSTPSSSTASARVVSGGNQQKTILSRALLAEASLVLAEEPTAGVDVGARAEIYRILRDLAPNGTLVVIVSSDIVELEGLCDRALVFSRGQVVGELAGDEVSETGIGRMMINATTLRRTDGAEPVRLLERRPTCGAASGAATMCRAAPSSPAAC